MVRVRRIDRKIGREALDNVRLFRVEAAYAVRFLLPRRAFETVYIMHPDPWPKARHAHHRIMGPTFLDALAEILAPGGRVHFSTDHLPYFHRVVELLAGRSDFEEIAPFRPGEEERSDSNGSSSTGRTDRALLDTDSDSLLISMRATLKLLA